MDGLTSPQLPQRRFELSASRSRRGTAGRCSHSELWFDPTSSSGARSGSVWKASVEPSRPMPMRVFIHSYERRRIVEAASTASEVIRRIGLLYAAEKQMRGSPPEIRLASKPATFSRNPNYRFSAGSHLETLVQGLLDSDNDVQQIRYCTAPASGRFDPVGEIIRKMRRLSG